jgi:hypothetical protein
MLSLCQLRALTRYYHTTYARSAEFHTISWVHGPLYAAPAILRYERRGDWKAEFLSCIDACSGLLQSHQVMEGFLKALFGMAVSAGTFSTAQAKQRLNSSLAGRLNCRPSEAPETGFIIDQDLSMESRDAAVGGVLAQRFDEMLLLEDIFDVERF